MGRAKVWHWQKTCIPLVLPRNCTEACYWILEVWCAVSFRIGEKSFKVMRCSNKLEANLGQVWGRRAAQFHSHRQRVLMSALACKGNKCSHILIVWQHVWGGAMITSLASTLKPEKKPAAVTHVYTVCSYGETALTSPPWVCNMKYGN